MEDFAAEHSHTEMCACVLRLFLTTQELEKQHNNKFKGGMEVINLTK